MSNPTVPSNGDEDFDNEAPTNPAMQSPDDEEHLIEMRDLVAKTDQAFADRNYDEARIHAQAAVRFFETNRERFDHLVISGFDSMMRCLTIWSEVRCAIELYRTYCLTDKYEEQRAAVDQALALLQPTLSQIEEDVPIDALILHYPLLGRALRTVIRLRGLLEGKHVRPLSKNPREFRQWAHRFAMGDFRTIEGPEQPPQ